jgi:phage protein U
MMRGISDRRLQRDLQDEWANQSAANRRPAGQADGAGSLAAIVAADRVFPAAVAELWRSA